MLFRLSQKLAKKIKEAPSGVLPLDPNPFTDWSGHLFTADRTQYIILTNTPSLYSAVMHGRGITDDDQLLDHAMGCIRELMVEDGFEFTYRRFVAPTASTVHFSKALNRSVTGSMNDMVYHAQVYLVEMGLSPFETSVRLNEVPMSALKCRNPRDVFGSMNVEPMGGASKSE